MTETLKDWDANGKFALSQSSDEGIEFASRLELGNRNYWANKTYYNYDDDKRRTYLVGLEEEGKQDRVESIKWAIGDSDAFLPKYKAPNGVQYFSLNPDSFAYFERIESINDFFATVRAEPILHLLLVDANFSHDPKRRFVENAWLMTQIREPSENSRFQRKGRRKSSMHHSSTRAAEINYWLNAEDFWYAVMGEFPSATRFLFRYTKPKKELIYGFNFMRGFRGDSK
jgi:hypothetical protein